MSEASSIKLPIIGNRKRLPALPGQPQGASYGVIWGACPEPPDAMCYVVEFLKGSRARILAYISSDGFAYRVDGPVTEKPARVADLAIARKKDGRGGGIYIRSHHGELTRVSSYLGSVEGELREVGETSWNARRELPYRDFMATLYLRYRVFSPQEAWKQRLATVPDNEVDTTFGKLAQPVFLFEGFDVAPLPDAIASLLSRIDAKDHPCGVELFARRVLAEIDHDHLRLVTATGELTLARIERMHGFYINMDRTHLTEDDIRFVLGVETALNRISRVLDYIGTSDGPIDASPSEETCALIDTRGFQTITEAVDSLLARLDDENPWACPGTVPCQPGGEWDVRTRMANLCEGLNLIARLEYVIRYDARRSCLAVQFIPPSFACMPSSKLDAENGSWSRVPDSARRRMADEFGARMSLVLAAAAFASGSHIEHAVVEERAFAGRNAVTHGFDRAEFLAKQVPLARELPSLPLDDGDAMTALAGRTQIRALGHVDDDVLHRPPRREESGSPRGDDRPLPPRLRDMLLADTPADLEVMEVADEPHLVRVGALREIAFVDPDRAGRELTGIIEELEASCVEAELLSDVPMISQYCENYFARMLLGLRQDDPRTRVHRIPDALFNAQFGIVNILARSGALEQALPEARKLLDMATTSSSSHFALINVLARLELYDEVIEVAKHGLSLAYERDAIAYYFYRMAFAYWSKGERDLALACYRIIPRGEALADTVGQEVRALMAEMGVSEEPTFAEARDAILAADIPLPPTKEVSDFLADAAVQLADGRFFFLSARCVYEMWRTQGRDELSVLNRSMTWL